jgi:hypothetical protein
MILEKVNRETNIMFATLKAISIVIIYLMFIGFLFLSAAVYVALNPVIIP